jgi:hypothetical protein
MPTPDRTDEIITRLEALERSNTSMGRDFVDLAKALSGLTGALGERCADHQRQLDDQKRCLEGLKKRDGGSSWLDPKNITIMFIAIGAIATAIAAIFGVKL